MNTYNVYDWILDFIRIMGGTISGIFSLPIFTVNDVIIQMGQLLLFDFMITILLKFAINLPTSGITINERIKRKNED